MSEKPSNTPTPPAGSGSKRRAPDAGTPGFDVTSLRRGPARFGVGPSADQAFKD